MDSFAGYSSSFSGFVDYSKCFHQLSTSWMIIGAILFFGTIISVIPQIQIVISNRSSFGLNTTSIWITSFSQFIMIINMICLHSSDFSGIIQLPFSETWQRMLTFCNIFILWFMYSFIPYLSNIFFDKKSRPARPKPTIERDRKVNNTMIVLLYIVLGLLITMTLANGVILGFTGPLIRSIGGLLGTIATALVFAQYLPQMITTCQLKDPGSLSLLMLMIQAPGGMINSLFMWLGNKDHWTTWISYFAASIQQFILLMIGFYFKCNKEENKYESLMNASPSTTTEMLSDR